MGVIKDARVEAVLPNTAGGALGGVAVCGVLAIHLPHEVRDRILAIADCDRMEMVGHEGVSGDPDVALLGVLLDQVQEALPISVGGKDGLFVVAPLGEVEPVTRRGEAKSAGHLCSSVI